MDKDKRYIADILRAIDTIMKYIEGTSEKEFIDPKNQQLQDAVIRRLEIIGEATKKLSKKIYDSYPEIPWHDIASTRDRLIHEYDVVDMHIVWDTLTSDLTELKIKLQQ